MTKINRKQVTLQNYIKTKTTIMAQEDVFKKIVSHCKEYGFVFPSSEIYDGLAAVYDYGQNGVAKNLCRKSGIN